jgi:prolyl-tRNA synthetase
MGVVVEKFHDEKGIVWPRTVAPFSIHLVTLSAKDPEEQERVLAASTALYEAWKTAGLEVVWDERIGVSPGEKFADADLIGVPHRVVVSQRTLASQSVEWKERSSADATLIKLEDAEERGMLIKKESYEAV